MFIGLALRGLLANTPVPSPSPIIVRVTGDVGIDRDWPLLLVQIVLVAATVALAWYTARLFRSTKDVATDTLIAARQADKHHQESLLPRMIPLGGNARYLEFLQVGNTSFVRTRDASGKKMPAVGDGTLTCSFRIELRYVNKGLGPAYRVKASVVIAGAKLPSFGLPDASAGEIVDAEPVNDIQVGELDLTPQTNYPMDVMLRYENIFERSGSTECTFDVVGDVVVDSIKYTAPDASPRKLVGA